MQTGRGRSPARLAASSEEWPPNSNSKSAATIVRYGSASSMSAQSLDQGVIEAADVPVAKADPQELAERQLRPLRLGHYALGDRDLVRPQAHVGLEPDPPLHRQFCRLGR